jgi:hypothetical protein
MSRLVLAGQGGPIPTISLPDPNSSGERPNLELVLEHGVPFEKAAYTSLGYTDFEIWCVGAAGGLGGGVADILWESTLTWDTMPIEVWNAYIQLAVTSGAVPVFVTGRYQRYPGVSYSGPWEELVPPRWMSYPEAAEYTNPYHGNYYRTWIQPYFGMQNKYKGFGGGGGGGGTHVVAGSLADLPDSIPVVIGLSGGDGALGHDKNLGTFVPEPESWYMRHNKLLDTFWGGSTDWHTDPSEMALVTLINAWGTRWPEPHNSVSPPQSGEDGQASSFGDIAQASGGQGGESAMAWEGGVRKLKGGGGAGGIGGQIEAGGGGAGSITSASGADGIWNRIIGGGGGGGRGGGGTGTALERPASAGGRGAFSYDDTTVYGQRQYPKMVSFSGSGVGRGSTYTDMIIPGGGGGVRVNRKKPFGSDADGYSPNGMLLLRLFKLDD